MKKTLFIILMIIIMTNSLNAEVQTLGVFKKSSCISLVQTCSNCTYNNISTIIYPNSTSLLINSGMTKTGTYYNYTFCNTDTLGDYIINGYGNPNGVKTAWSYNLKVSNTGENLSLFSIIIVIAFLVICLVSLYIGSTFKSEQFILKSSFNLISLLFGLLAINSATIIVSESTGLTLMSNMGLILSIVIFLLMLLYTFIYWTVQTIQSVKEKKGVRWNY